MARKTESHWALLGSSIVVGLIASLVGACFVVMLPLAGIDRFALAAMTIPTVWVFVCLHLMLSARPVRWSVGYSAVSVALLGAGIAHQAFS